jgi:putative two-component system response regulator
MFLTRTAGLREAMARAPSPVQVGVVGFAILITVAIFGVGIVVERFGDAPLFLFAVPLALAAMGWGLRGGVILGVLTSLFAVAWWVDRSYPGGGAWVSSRVITCLLIGVLLGWFAESRHQLLRAIAHHRECSLDLIATANFDGYFTEVNPAFTRTLGFTAEELLAAPFTEFVHPDDLETTLAAVVEQTEEGRDVLNFQNRYRTKDGSYRWLEWMSSPDPLGRDLIAVARDITDRKRLEELEHEYQHRLETDVRERTKELSQRNAELEEARRETLYRLALAAEYRDDDTFAHTKRISVSAALLARELGLPESEVALIGDAAPLHDIGKLGVSDAVLLKPGKLTQQEIAHVRRHAELGAGILSGSSSDVLRAGEAIALSHHEWWDGTGYPAGLRGEEIPLYGRLVAIADVFDALTHQRPYKKAWRVEDAVDEIRRLRGRQFDPKIIEAFERLDPYELAGVSQTEHASQAMSKGTRAA